MEKMFQEQLSKLHITLNETQLKQFKIYYELLIAWNKKMNLTAITNQEDVYQKHFYDSIALVLSQPITNQTLLDVGSGAGFPSIPLKIIYPNLQVTIIDALQKRITFLTELTKQLGIEVALIHGRAEEYKRKNAFDIVTARAVANLQMLSELCIPFVKVNGVFLAMKGPKILEEIPLSSNAIRVLGGEIKDTTTYNINDSTHYILSIQKVTKTSKQYPRKFKDIKANPL